MAPDADCHGVNPFQREMLRVREHNHGRCVVCGAQNTDGLHVDFRALSDGSVEAEFPPRPSLVGYPGRIHGGIIAALLDGAMTNCLFANDIVAVTAELTIRYHDPVSPELPVKVRARLERSAHRLYRVAAWIRQGDEMRVSARARFLALPKSAGMSPIPGDGRRAEELNPPGTTPI